MRQGLRRLIADAVSLSEKMDRDDATGWIVVCVDEEEPMSLVYASGPYDSPEQALVAATRLQSTSCQPYPGEAGWRHDVVPVFHYEHVDGKKT